MHLIRIGHFGCALCVLFVFLFVFVVYIYCGHPPKTPIKFFGCVHSQTSQKRWTLRDSERIGEKFYLIANMGRNYGIFLL